MSDQIKPTVRMQIMPLTEQTVGEFTTTPFVLVLDGDEEILEAMSAEELTGLKDQSGATALFVSLTSTLDVSGRINLTDEQQADIVDRLRRASNADDHVDAVHYRDGWNAALREVAKNRASSEDLVAFLLEQGITP